MFVHQYLNPNFSNHSFGLLTNIDRSNTTENLTADQDILKFRQFSILPRARLLLRAGQSVQIGSRAFDLLVILVCATGRVVSKDEIVKYVWPTTMVEECNLRFQVASLRKALGRDRDLVKTIPGRGYFFAADESPFSQNLDPDGRHSPLHPVEKSVEIDGTVSGRQVPVTLAASASHNEALRQFFQSAGQLVAVYGSIENLLNALPLAGHSSLQLE